MRECLSTSEIIAIFDIVATIIIGVYVARVIQGNLTRNRAIKDYYISELIEIKKLYSVFFNRIYKDDYKAKDLKNWFKILSNRIKILDDNIHTIFNICNLNIIESHSRTQIFLTNLEEFNNHWNTKIPFKDSSKNDILEFYTDFNNVIHKAIIEINMVKGANKKNDKISNRK